MLARRWRTSGPFRLLIVAVAVAAGVALVAMASSGSDRAVDRTSAERAQLRSLHTRQARIRAAERRDPVLRRERARLRADQRARFGRVGAGVGAAWPMKSHAEQGAVVTSLEHAI